jgi:hypothetical protein
LETGPILGHFKNYLEYGIYPFFLEGIEDYLSKLLNVLEKVLYEDIPTVTGIKTGNVPVLKRMLWLIATSQPFIPNIERMSRNLNISKEYVYIYLHSLERAGLLSGFLPAESGYRLVRKPSKIYMENTNLLRAVAGEVGGRGDKGVKIRRFFFHLFVLMKSHATSSQNRRARVPCIISPVCVQRTGRYAGVLSDETFLKTIPIETGFWKDLVNTPLSMINNGICSFSLFNSSAIRFNLH